MLGESQMIKRRKRKMGNKWTRTHAYPSPDAVKTWPESSSAPSKTYKLMEADQSQELGVIFSMCGSLAIELSPFTRTNSVTRGREDCELPSLTLGRPLSSAPDVIQKSCDVLTAHDWSLLAGVLTTPLRSGNLAEEDVLFISPLFSKN